MDLTSIFKRYKKRYIDTYPVSPEQRHALDATLHCHTPRYGTLSLRCNHCEYEQLQYPSCGHRSCHRCLNHLTTQWLERQSQKLLPVEYFMVTFTAPFQLRALFMQHQKLLYDCLFRCAISTLKDFGLRDKKIAAELAMTAVLHTHSRQLNYHPHLHDIVPGGALNKKHRLWKKVPGKYLFKQTALAKVFRARLMQAIRSAHLSLPPGCPKQWVVDCQHVGQGLPALKYLSRYLYRGVIHEKNVIIDDGNHVTFRYTDNKGVEKRRTLKGEDFLKLIFQHVLPKGFRRVRDYGFLHPNAKVLLKRIQLILHLKTPTVVPAKSPDYLCKRCQNPLMIIAFTPPSRRSGVPVSRAN